MAGFVLGIDGRCKKNFQACVKKADCRQAGQCCGTSTIQYNGADVLLSVCLDETETQLTSPFDGQTYPFECMLSDPAEEEKATTNTYKQCS